jgi:hypothetical protein
MIWFSSLLLIFEAIAYLLLSKYTEVAFSDSYINCSTQNKYNTLSVWYVLQRILTEIKLAFSHLINVQQIMEWLSMVYIIQTQKNRTVEEIYFDHNNEHLHDEFSPN